MSRKMSRVRGVRVSGFRRARFRAIALAGSAAATLVALPAGAASDTWDNGGGDNNWQNVTNWASDSQFPGATTGFTSTDDATFGTAGAGGTINLGDLINIRTLVFGVSGADAASFTIGDGNDTLNLTAAGGITINAGVTTAQNIGVAGTTINLPNTLTGTTTFTNNGSGLLTVAGNLVQNAPTGSSATVNSSLFTVTGSGSTTFTGSISNAGAALTTTVGTSLLKTGSGTLTLSNGSVWAGNGAQATASATNQYPVAVRSGTLLLNGGTHSVTGELVIGGFTTAGAAGNDARIQVDAGTLSISGFLSIGRGNGIGAVSSDLVLNNAATVTAGNFSAGFNGGSASNLPKGSITLNNTSSLSIGTNGQFTFAESAGSSFTMTLNNSSSITVNGAGSATNRAIGTVGNGTLALNGSSSFTAGNSIMNVGYQNGAGTVTINTGTTFTNGGELRVAASNTNGTFTGSGTVNVSGGTLNVAAITLSRNNNDVASTFAATINLNSGTVNVSNGGTLVGWRGTSSAGTISIAGGTFNQGTTAATNMDLGTFGGAKGTVIVSGTGALTMQNNSNLRFSANLGNNTSNAFTISGGNVTFYSDAGATPGGTGVIDLMNTAATGATNTVNLDGGTLTANQIKSTSASGTRVFNFNGGTLKSGAAALAGTFFASGVATTANVRNNGAIIDTNGNAVTIGQTLSHSLVGGDNPTDGGLTKNGSGVLTLTAANDYTGGTIVSVGGLTVSGASAALGTGTVTVQNTATTLTILSGVTNAIADTATVNLAGGGAVFGTADGGYLTLGAGINETVGALFLNGAAQAGALTYGATGSGANVTNDEYFSGTGVLTVVPEPTALGLIGLTGIGLLRRRRGNEKRA